MSANPFYRLAPFIQEHIYRHQWQALHDIQVEAISAILDSPDHLLISSGTASGKTEAAMLPIITDLHNDPPASIGALYIGPLKALINDQFERLADLLEESQIPAQSWHGDVAQARKTRFLRRARGILQITPESLEAMLMNRHHELRRLFHDLRYVVIDEIHAFMESDRGRQIICQLERIARFQKHPARRIGLSATLGEPELAMDFLRGSHAAPVRYILGQEVSRREVGLEYFLLPDSRKREPEDRPSAQNDDQSPDQERAFYDHLYTMSRRESKTLAFANSRASTERIVMKLREAAEARNQEDIFHAHHGSISAPMREAAEAAMKDPDKPACTAATITLELGIDLGQLDQVLQVNATHTVSSFVQRLGRSGRRGGPARMFFYATEEDREAKHLGDELPWNLLQTIAIIELYREEKWIEPPRIPRMPLNLLYHQTMSIVKAHSELFPPRLAERVLTLSPFKTIAPEQFRLLLRHLLAIGHLERTADGKLIIGLEAESLVNSYQFYAVFCDEVEFRVRDGSREIGRLQGAPEPESSIILAGYAWQVLEVDLEARVIYVKRIKRANVPEWRGGPIDIHTRVLQKIREILGAGADYPYLGPNALRRLASARQLAERASLDESSILPLGPGKFLILPFCGTLQASTQMRLLEYAGISSKSSYLPYYYEIETDEPDLPALRAKLDSICAAPPDAEDLPAPLPCQCDKYARYLPQELLTQAYTLDCTDIAGAIESLERL